MPTKYESLQFWGLGGLDKAKKPNLGLERYGKSQKAKFGGLEGVWKRLSQVA